MKPQKDLYFALYIPYNKAVVIVSTPQILEISADIRLEIKRLMIHNYEIAI
jgi:hypothetical protein